MLEQPGHQAAGLLSFARPQTPKLMAMVSHGDDNSELPLLWKLCSSMVDFGYTVTVLDATTHESETNPGLEQLLEYTRWSGDTHHEQGDWTVIPAALGLQRLSAMPERSEQNLQLLGKLFQNEGTIVIYGNTDLLVPLLAQTGIKPLLAVAPMKTSLITSYRALKHLLLEGKLQPTVVNLIGKHATTAATTIGSVAASLGDCARNFLDYEVNALTITTLDDEDQTCADIQHLALRMVESALPIEIDFAPATPQYAPVFFNTPLARSH